MVKAIDVHLFRLERRERRTPSLKAQFEINQIFFNLFENFGR